MKTVVGVDVQTEINPNKNQTITKINPNKNLRKRIM